MDDISTEALLFQTGYLTIHEVEESLPGHWGYTLGYPNREVESSLNKALLPAYGLDAVAFTPPSILEGRAPQAVLCY